MSDFLTRLIEERDQLQDRYNKLGAFIGTPSYDGIRNLQQHALQIQHAAMYTYLMCLNTRIHDLRFAANDEGSNPPNGPGTPP